MSKLTFQDDALSAIAQARRSSERPGARGLRSIMEAILLDTMYEVFPASTAYARCGEPGDRRGTGPAHLLYAERLEEDHRRHRLTGRRLEMIVCRGPCNRLTRQHRECAWRSKVRPFGATSGRPTSSGSGPSLRLPFRYAFSATDADPTPIGRFGSDAGVILDGRLTRPTSRALPSGHERRGPRTDDRSTSETGQPRDSHPFFPSAISSSSRT